MDIPVEIMMTDRERERLASSLASLRAAYSVRERRCSGTLNAISQERLVNSVTCVAKRLSSLDGNVTVIGARRMIIEWARHQTDDRLALIIANEGKLPE